MQGHRWVEDIDGPWLDTLQTNTGAGRKTLEDCIIQVSLECIYRNANELYIKHWLTDHQISTALTVYEWDVQYEHWVKDMATKNSVSEEIMRGYILKTIKIMNCNGVTVPETLETLTRIPL